jgi:hypothetical protein
MGHAESLLQPPEPRLPAVERDDLPVHRQVTAERSGQCPGDLGEGAGDIALAAAH